MCTAVVTDLYSSTAGTASIRVDGRALECITPADLVGSSDEAGHGQILVYVVFGYVDTAGLIVLSARSPAKRFRLRENDEWLVDQLRPSGI